MEMPFTIEEKEGDMYQHNIDKCWRSVLQITHEDCPQCGYDRMLVKKFYENGVFDEITFEKCMNPRCDYQVDGDGEPVSDMRVAVDSTML